ncbi:SufE-like protein, chloroplastic [Quillaja saponaria]|uniref:SufE-like protein, chloroplastic n=1 Tax=Quillaja saponaria TaxID=32244 RepID=A0AAD7LF15_QUISA|nr:SufE-like protein, chloroplastic [Quillaja saponaria]KAJ7956768.1 SufE-like protein, chloroplastic [Quillaja saponaria]
MISATLPTSPTFSTSSIFTNLVKDSNFINPRYIKLELKNGHERKFSFKLMRCIRSSDNAQLNAQRSSYAVCFFTGTHIPVEMGTTEIVAVKLKRLVSEFKSLPGPIDRVKRLLHYAALFPPVDDSVRAPENRVIGCATQVWLDAEMNEFGRMRFRADSDSEISKGFSYCLIWMLDGALPEEVLKVTTEDLKDMNVGLHSKAQSRVNTWQNVLISMQEKTKALVAEKEGRRPLDTFPSLAVAVDHMLLRKELFP